MVKLRDATEFEDSDSAGCGAGDRAAWHTALTLEAAAEEAGLTKPGLMYHFRTRDDLLMAIQRHLTETWEEQLLSELGKPLEQSTARERAAAYARVTAHGSASKAELAFMVESATSPELRRCGTT